MLTQDIKSTGCTMGRGREEQNKKYTEEMQSKLIRYPGYVAFSASSQHWEFD